MKNIRYILYSLAVSVLAACSEDVIEPNLPNVDAFDGTMTFCADVPRLNDANTRACGLEADLDNMDLYAYEFEWGDSYAARFLHRVHKAKNVHKDGNVVKFTLDSLEQTDEHRVIHFIAMPEGTELPDISDFNSAATILPRLYVGGGTDLYGGRVEFSNGYCELKRVDGKDVWNINSDLSQYYTTPIPLLRNFAQINVTNNAADFTLEGFAVVNTPEMGSAEPWHADLLHVCDFRDSSGNLKSYREIDNTGYKGYMPPCKLENYDIENLKFTTAPKYIYERPYTSNNRTYVIVKGHRGNGASTYYKLDIGNEDEVTSSFKYYNILRNFRYNIIINKVDVDGETTAQKAAEGTVYNNQIASVEADQLTSISDGKDLITTNQVNHVFTSTDSFTFRLSYSELATATNRSNDIQFQIGQGNVIADTESWDQDGYKYLKVIPNTPTDYLEQQTIIAYVTGGLSKKLELVLTNPYPFKNVVAFRGSHNDKPNGSDYVENEISSMAGQTMTLYLDLAKGLPSSVFPIEIYLESYEQELENDKHLGTMVVQTGESLFDDITDTRISYKRTVTEDEYHYYISTDSENPGKVQNSSKTVMCRFSFIKSADALKNDSSIIRIRSNIFNDYDFKFKRTDSCPTETN